MATFLLCPPVHLGISPPLPVRSHSCWIRAPHVTSHNVNNSCAQMQPQMGHNSPRAAVPTLLSWGKCLCCWRFGSWAGAAASDQDTSSLGVLPIHCLTRGLLFSWGCSPRGLGAVEMELVAPQLLANSGHIPFTSVSRELVSWS